MAMPAAARRQLDALWLEAFVSQEQAMLPHEYSYMLYQQEELAAEQAAEQAAERFWEEGPAHQAFYRSSLNDREEARAAYGLGAF